MEECLAYFRQAVADPRSVPPWSAWWSVHEDLVQQVFPRMDYVRLRHRRLRGAREILQARGELPEDYTPPDPMDTGSCTECGERTTNHPAGPGGGSVHCPNCGLLIVYDCERKVTFWE
jgi:hypothetical protein